MNLLAKLASSTRFLLIIVLVMVGLWMFITPFYNAAIDIFNIPPEVQVCLGAIIVYVGVKEWKLHPKQMRGSKKFSSFQIPQVPQPASEFSCYLLKKQQISFYME